MDGENPINFTMSLSLSFLGWLPRKKNDFFDALGHVTMTMTSSLVEFVYNKNTIKVDHQMDLTICNRKECI